MNELLFNIIAISATAGFVLGVISGWLPLLVVSIIIAGLLHYASRRLS
ncbi:MAG: hypothetical protein P1V20_13170 [Verrucomicrobiales bacterium]|nr:hypothetical protein [Verrucomicrobiales bacterium]